MKFGVYLPHVGHGAGPGAIREVAAAAEELRFASAWAGDHLAPPANYDPAYPFGNEGRMPVGAARPYLEAFTTLSFIAGATQQLSLGISVCVVPYRHPVLLAKVVATLDVLAGGRIILGVGVGWMREEFDAMGLPFERRGAMTDEALDVLRLAWSDEQPVSFAGRWSRLDSMYFEPVPAQGDAVPIWVGGTSEPALRRAARVGDAWHPHLFGAYPDRLRMALDRIAELRGPERAAIGCALFVPLDLTDRSLDTAPPWETGVLTGGPEAAASRLRQLAAVPVDHIILAIGGGVAARIRTMERFADEVLPLLD